MNKRPILFFLLAAFLLASSTWFAQAQVTVNPNTGIGSGGGGGGGAVTIAAGADITTGNTTDAACAGDATSGCTVEARLIRIAQNLTTVNTSVNANPAYLGVTTVPISVSTATTTQLVALSGTTQIRVTSLSLIAGGTGNATFVYGTGSNCATGLTSLTGAYNLTAQSGLALGAGLGNVLIAPAGQALCITTSAAVQMSGHVTYAQS